MELQNQYRQFARFVEGRQYMIYCTGNEMCLRSEIPIKGKPVVVAAVPDTRDPRQIWQLRLKHDKECKYSILNVYSSLAMIVEHQGTITLRQDNNDKHQWFFMAKPRVADETGLIIRCTYAQEMALCLYGALHFRDINANAQNYIFRFEQLQDNFIEVQSTMFLNAQSRKAMDITGASKKQGAELIQYTKNNKFNQRFFLKHVRNGDYHIENLHSLMNLDCSNKTDLKVRQWIPNRSASQLWRLEKLQGNQYRIRSSERKEFIVGVANVSMEDKALIMLVPDNDPSGSWFLEGWLPPDLPPESYSQSHIPTTSVVGGQIPTYRLNNFTQQLSSLPNQSIVQNMHPQSKVIIQQPIYHQIIPNEIYSTGLPHASQVYASKITTHNQQMTTSRTVDVTYNNQPLMQPSQQLFPSRVATCQSEPQTLPNPNMIYNEYIPDRIPMPFNQSGSSQQEHEIEVLRMPMQVSHIKMNNQGIIPPQQIHQSQQIRYEGIPQVRVIPAKTEQFRML